jgi:hypothetical protein
MLATFAFDVCHDVYRAARETIDSKIPTLNAEASGKYLWRPDRMPRLAEFVCDFARLGERAVDGENWPDFRRNGAQGVRAAKERGKAQIAGKRVFPGDNQTSSATNGVLAASRSRRLHRASPQNSSGASRVAMFRVYYLGGAEYEAARRHLGISEFTWADWAEEIRRRAGREFARAGLFPPSKYFRESSAQAS